MFLDAHKHEYEQFEASIRLKLASIFDVDEGVGARGGGGGGGEVSQQGEEAVGGGGVELLAAIRHHPLQTGRHPRPRPRHPNRPVAGRQPHDQATQHLTVS